MKKLILLIMMFGVASYAQNISYSTHNYTSWKVIEANIELKYVVLKPSKEIQVGLIKPICVSDTKWVFKYELMGHDDSFYNKNEEVIELTKISRPSYRNNTYSLKIDVEEDDLSKIESNEINNSICTKTQTERFVNPVKNSNKYGFHGMIKYVGDVSIIPPF